MPGARVAVGDQVTLRTVEAEDVEFRQRASANPEIRYPLGNPLRSSEALDDPDDGDRFLVCLDDDVGPAAPTDADAVRPVGEVSLMDGSYKRPELGYWLVPEVHGEGHGTEAVALAIDHAFRSYEAPAVGAEAFEYNDASRGLLESLGFTEEGRRRDYMFVDGAYRDMVCYGLGRTEWDREFGD